MSDVARFRAMLDDSGSVHIDAAVLALHLTAHPRYLALTRTLLAGMHDGDVRGCTSSLSLYQLLAEPYRHGAEGAAERAEACLTAFPGLEIVPVTPAIARQAARVRAQLGGGLLRAVQIATALEGGAEAFVTQRSALRRIAGMGVEQLDTYVEPLEASPSAD